MRVPDPKANTTTEAYLAYKAGFLEESELKPKLYEPDLHFDGWLACWAGLVNTYPTKENGDPEMLCDEEALVAYLSGVVDTYPEEIKDPYDVRIVGYLRHLASIRWPEPDYPVNNEEFYLSTMDPTHTSNPEPSSDIELDTAEGKIISVEAYGDTYQPTYSGKNLISNAFSNNYAPYGDNGFILAKPANRAIQLNFPSLLPAGTYTLSFDVVAKEAPSDVGGSFNAGDNTNLGSFFISSTGNFTKTVTTSVAIHHIYMYIYGNDPDGSTITIDKMQLESGSVATSFEPYVGGPSPNPDYPQDVQVVTGEQTVKITGKNLFPLGTGSYTNHGLTSVYNADGSITVSGTANATYADLTANRLVNYEQGKTYTVSITEALPCSFGLITLGSGAQREDIIIAVGNKSGKKTLIYTHNIAKLYIYNLTVGQSYNFTIYPMVEEGSTATDYQPYQLQSYPISFGSIELCKIGDYQDYIYKSGDDWYVHKACKSMTLSIADMNNDEAYPGWKNLTSLKADLGAVTPSTGNTGHIDGYCPYYTNIKGYVAKGSQTSNEAYVSCNFNNNNAIVYLQNSVYGLTQTQWKTQYPNLNFELYYCVATPTDTQITDSTLIGQLNALAGADTYNEKTYIKVTATDPNLPALLKVEAYKY